MYVCMHACMHVCILLHRFLFSQNPHPSRPPLRPISNGAFHRIDIESALPLESTAEMFCQAHHILLSEGELVLDPANGELPLRLRRTRHTSSSAAAANTTTFKPAQNLCEIVRSSPMSLSLSSRGLVWLNAHSICFMLFEKAIVSFCFLTGI